MNPKMNKTLVAALKRCRDITPTTLDEFLGPLLDRDPDDLARLPGTPGTVLAAQFTCYAKSSASLSEVLRRQTTRGRDRAAILGGRESRRSINVSEQTATETAVMPSELEQLPDLAGYLKLVSSPAWLRVGVTRP